MEQHDAIIEEYGIVEEGPIVSEEDLLEGETEEGEKNHGGICL